MGTGDWWPRDLGPKQEMRRRVADNAAAPRTRLATTAITVGIVTRNRPMALARCLASLARLDGLARDIIVVDDASDEPIDGLVAASPASVVPLIRIVHQPGAQGPIVARNTIVRLASHECVLLLDDDAYVLDGGAIRRGLSVFDADAHVCAVAFAQAEADGAPWPTAMQPARVDWRCQVPAYIGFAHLLRRSTFLDLGGYREALHFYGEEKDFCIRALEAGRSVVYLPDARVAHVPDRGGRSASRYLRHVIRNDCFYALFNEPWPLPGVSVPVRLVRYWRMRRHGGTEDAGGLRWILGELWRTFPSLLAARRPVKWATIWRWRHLARLSPPWPSAM